MAFANATGRAIVTTNPQDFRRLHERGQAHHGILGVYQDGDPKKDMSWRDVTVALENLEATGMQLRGVFVVLNRYRWYKKQTRFR